MNKIGMRLMTLFAATLATVAAMGQNQQGYAEAHAAAMAASPGYAFRIDLKANFTGGLYWEYQIAKPGPWGSRVRVATPDIRVTRIRSLEVDSRVPRSGLNPVTAGANAVQAASAKYGADMQILRFEAIGRSDGSVRYRVKLNILGDDGGMFDQDLEVTLDSTGKVIKIERSDDY